MYYKIGISQLSPNQLSRLRNGHPVRIGLGSAHHIHLSAPQLKKLHFLHKKGSRYTIIFDPHQAEQHASGLMGDIAKGVKAAFHKHKHLLNPVIRTAKGYAHKGLSRATKYAHEKIDSFPEFQQGHGMMDDVATTLAFNSYLNHRGKGRGMKHIKGEGVFGGVLNGAAGLSNLIGGNGSSEAADILRGVGGVANVFGLGLKHNHKKHHHKRRGGALYPA